MREVVNARNFRSFRILRYPLSHFGVRSPQPQLHALPAEIGLSGIPGISGRERGVAWKPKPPMDWGGSASSRACDGQ